MVLRKALAAGAVSAFIAFKEKSMTMLTRPAVDLKVAEKARPRLGTEHGERTQGNCAWPPCRRVLRQSRRR